MEDHGKWWNSGYIPGRMSSVGETPLQIVVLDELAGTTAIEPTRSNSVVQFVSDHELEQKYLLLAK